MSERLVVVGGKGFIGGSLVSHLKRNHIAFLSITRDEFDLLNKNDCKAICNILLPTDVIVFCSAITPARSSKDVIDSILMLQNFIDAISNLAIKGFILISSDAVYGDFHGTIDEESPYSPSTFHGLTQVAREIILNTSYLEHKSILRLCAVFGPGDTHNSYGPNRFVNQIRNNDLITVLGLGANKRDHLYIDDAVKIIALFALANISGVFNLASGFTLSFKEVAMACRQEFSPNAAIEFVGSEGPIFDKIIDVTRLRNLSLGHTPKSFELGLAQWRVAHKQAAKTFE